jgi:hypothetical protein
VIDARVTSGAEYLVLGAVRGLAADAARIGPALDGFRPVLVALALSEDEYRGIREYFVVPAVEPIVSLTGNEVAEIRGLARYGEVRVPNPTWAATIAWGLERGVPVEPVDPSDETYATMFTDHIGYPELVRRTLRERSLTRRPPTPPTPDEFALEWSARISSKGGSARLAAARDAAAVGAVRRFATRGGRIAVIVDRERFDGVVGLLQRSAGTGRSPVPG